MSDPAVFISGHSLVDRPFPDYLEAIAKSLGQGMVWNRQYRVGSSIKLRVRGLGSGDGEGLWQGYKQGEGRDGRPIDVIAELRTPSATGGRPYDVLIITEQHNLLSAIYEDDSARMLRHFHDLFISANPAGRTYFFEPWLGIVNKSAPASWIAYERAAAPVWQCLVAEVNASLERAGRKDRIASIPVNLALAELIERVASPGGLPGFPQGDVGAAVSLLVNDDVHLTSAGHYFSALVTYAVINGVSPAGAWSPPDVPPALRDTLQTVAAELASRPEDRVRLSREACQAYILTEFNDYFWTYVYQGYGNTPINPLLRWARTLKHMAERTLEVRRTRASASAPGSPFLQSAEHDADYWYAAP